MNALKCFLNSFLLFQFGDMANIWAVSVLVVNIRDYFDTKIFAEYKTDINVPEKNIYLKQGLLYPYCGSKSQNLLEKDTKKEEEYCKNKIMKDLSDLWRLLLAKCRHIVSHENSINLFDPTLPQQVVDYKSNIHVSQTDYVCVEGLYTSIAPFTRLSFCRLFCEEFQSDAAMNSRHSQRARECLDGALNKFLRLANELKDDNQIDHVHQLLNNQSKYGLDRNIIKKFSDFSHCFSLESAQKVVEWAQNHQEDIMTLAHQYSVLINEAKHKNKDQTSSIIDSDGLNTVLDDNNHDVDVQHIQVQPGIKTSAHNHSVIRHQNDLTSHHGRDSNEGASITSPLLIQPNSTVVLSQATVPQVSRVVSSEGTQGQSLSNRNPGKSHKKRSKSAKASKKSNKRSSFRIKKMTVSKKKNSKTKKRVKKNNAIV